MTEKEFVIWLKGFVEGVHHYNVTPSQWDLLKDKLSTVGSSNESLYLLNDLSTVNISY